MIFSKISHWDFSAENDRGMCACITCRFMYIVLFAFHYGKKTGQVL